MRLNGTNRRRTPAEAASAGPEAPGAGLPRPIQEHLASSFRTTYNVETAEKPAYLGDPVLPLEFELLLQRIEASERQRIREMAHTQGIEAVERALRDLGAGPAGAEGGLSPASKRRGWVKGALSETARPSPDRPRLLPGSRPPFRQSVGQGSARLALESEGSLQGDRCGGRHRLRRNPRDYLKPMRSRLPEDIRSAGASLRPEEDVIVARGA